MQQGEDSKTSGTKPELCEHETGASLWVLYSQLCNRGYIASAAIPLSNKNEGNATM